MDAARRNAMKLDLEPDWDAIQSVWDRCVDYLNACGLDPDSAYALSMVTQELLENAVKYGTYRETQRIGLEIEAAAEAVFIEVRTPLGSELRLERLDTIVQWIRGFQNPFESYVERMKEVSGRSYGNSESGLGLVRIAYEGQCLLDFYVDEANVLAMSAIYDRKTGRGRAANQAQRQLREQSAN